MNLAVKLKSAKEFFNWLFDNGHDKMFTLPSNHDAEDEVFKERILKNVDGNIWISQGNVFSSRQHKEYIKDAFRN